MHVALEVHAPGLDMAVPRWTYHLIFMQEVHKRLDSIAEQARAAYQEKGPGTLLIDCEQWMEVVRDAVTDERIDGLPHHYLSAQEVTERCKFGLLSDGLSHVIFNYDPEQMFVLTVEHYPDGLVSCYMIEPGGRDPR